MRNMNLNQKMVDCFFYFGQVLKFLNGTTKVIGKFDDDVNFLKYPSLFYRFCLLFPDTSHFI